MMNQTGFLLLLLVAAFGGALAILVRLRAEQAQKEQANLESARAQQELDNVKMLSISKLEEIEAGLAHDREAMQRQIESARSHYESQLAAELAKLEPLRRFAVVRDAETEAQRMLAEAIALAERLRDETKIVAERDRSRAERELASALSKIEELKGEARGILESARVRAREVVDRAEAQAAEIGGEAYFALREHSRLNDAIKAIRNVIDGYGDRYVVPTQSVVDALAADYSHTEAGERLIAARDHTRRMVEQGLAASCEYAEARRRDTAIRFILDAFNGHVDAVLARSRHDNVGTLEQEIRDEYALVNLNGEAFRNTRIRLEYLEARLDELRWAVAAQELRWREREEQRRIQEQIREEEKVRKEIERALKESAASEAAIRRAIEEERSKANVAAEGERKALEEHIAVLAEQLAAAVAKSQRALSMAQQTKAGVVYIISNVGSFGEDVLKIGMTRRLEPHDRVRELGDASVPFTFDVHAMIQTDDAPALERELHEHFAGRRINLVNFRKEFFRIPTAELRQFVAEKKLEAAFTLVAEAREYRESESMRAAGTKGETERMAAVVLSNDGLGED